VAEAKVETASAWLSQVHAESTAVDHAIFDAVKATRTPTLDGLLVRLSNAANNSRLWLVTAGAVAAVGGPRGRRAAAEAVLSIGMASAVSNIALKGLGRRRRPAAPADGEEVASRWVRHPTSPSFPSGHSASAFAFASTMGEEMPATWLPLHLTATLVGYARVHTGVHYPSDVVAGAVVGALCGWTVRRIAERVAPRDRPEEGRRGVVG
jgi:undecaprenyl-diphosphatase